MRNKPLFLSEALLVSKPSSWCSKGDTRFPNPEPGIGGAWATINGRLLFHSQIIYLADEFIDYKPMSGNHALRAALKFFSTTQNGFGSLFRHLWQHMASPTSFLQPGAPEMHVFEL